MIHSTELIVPSDVAKVINFYLTEKPKNEDECQSANEPITLTATFKNGYQVDVQCCGVKYDPNSDSNLSWTQAILYDENGREVCVAGPCDQFFFNWEIDYDGDVYVAHVR